jgi:hypothetical protein
LVSKPIRYVSGRLGNSKVKKGRKYE